MQRLVIVLAKARHIIKTIPKIVSVIIKRKNAALGVAKLCGLLFQPEHHRALDSG